MDRVHAILLGNDYLSQPITTANPVAGATKQPLKIGHPRRRRLSNCLDDLSSDVGILAPLRLADERLVVEQSLHSRTQRLAELHAIALASRHSMIRENH